MLRRQMGRPLFDNLQPAEDRDAGRRLGREFNRDRIRRSGTVVFADEGAVVAAGGFDNVEILLNRLALDGHVDDAIGGGGQFLETRSHFSRTARTSSS